MSLTSKEKSTRLISINENLLVEVDSEYGYETLGKPYAEPAKGNLEIAPIVENIYQLLRRINDEAIPEQIEIGINLAIDEEGNAYLAQRGTNAHLEMKLIYNKPTN